MTYPDEEYRNMKETKRYYDRLAKIADAHYGIPMRCPCGGSILHDVSPEKKFSSDRDTLLRMRYFTYTKFKNDGLHFHQPWVFAIEDKVKGLLTYVEDMAQKIAQLKAQLNRLTRP